MIDIKRISNNIERMLPDIVYSEDTSVKWDNDFQKSQLGKRLTIFLLEEMIRELETIRGENVYVYVSGGYQKPLEVRLKEIEIAIKQIRIT